MNELSVKPGKKSSQDHINSQQRKEPLMQTQTLANTPINSNLVTRCLLVMIIIGLNCLMVGAAQTVTANKDLYSPHEDIVVTFAGFPALCETGCDWITVVENSTPTNSYQAWDWLHGKGSGTMTFDGLPSGNYEVRGYQNWDTEGYKGYVAKYAFKVGTKTSSNVSIRTEIAASGKNVFVYYSGMPGNATDWITIMPVGGADTSYGDWEYTGGNESGEVTLRVDAPGEYEIRVYFDWSGTNSYEVMHRHRVTVP